MPDPRHFRLDGPGVTLIIAIIAQVPVALYWGPRLAADAADVLALAARAAANASPDVAAPLALTPQLGQGWPGQPGLAAHRDGRDWASLALFEAAAVTPSRLVLTSRDAAHGLLLTHDLRLDGDVLVATTRLDNLGDTALTVDQLAAPVLPIPADATRIIGLEGRWAGEFQTQVLDRPTGIWLRENRRGRTSHDAPPTLFVTDANASETQGRAWGWHLGWSGNHRLAVETLSDGRGSVAMAALHLPGEVRLASGESLTTPPLYATVSAQGLGGVSRRFHAWLRGRPEHARLRAKPRPVHYNSWEAVYFDHDPAVLTDLASRAAALGVERFVLDDGWFEGRRSDRAGLGDWRVDRAIYPEGLGPLIDHVHGLGMDFGLWVEPEMVNPDSALFRAHPDWVLGTPPAPQIGFRHQLVLDFGRAEVRDHLYAAIAALLTAHPIAYLKWDMNRDISQPGGSDGHAAAWAHVLGVYAVLDRLRAEFPAVEIESCASGGGRADFGILARTDRIWTSDSNDALDRLAIQRGFSLLFPAELMGSHVGPRRCHITGRVLAMPLRIATAMFGHMGLEMDLRELDAAEAQDLAAGIALHKAWRPLIHGGDLHRLDSEIGVNAFLIAAADGAEALLSYTMVTQPRGYYPATLRLAGLDPAAHYRLRCVWPPRLGDAAVLADGVRVSGAALLQAGWQPPRLHPGTALVLALTRE
ncbi:MAG: alpha-galactosidase [Alphaproteobacteria bacterium PA4]|nr:MAG: alpha-galactosidase [Alphaproteobacteria bacterium PA4]